jgi:hypothetical protein
MVNDKTTPRVDIDTDITNVTNVTDITNICPWRDGGVGFIRKSWEAVQAASVIFSTNVINVGNVSTNVNPGGACVNTRRNGPIKLKPFATITLVIEMGSSVSEV